MAQHHLLKKEEYPEIYRQAQTTLDKAFLTGIGLNISLLTAFNIDIVNRRKICSLPSEYAAYSNSVHAFNIYNIKPKSKFFKDFLEGEKPNWDFYFEVHSDSKGNTTNIYFVY